MTIQYLTNATIHTLNPQQPLADTLAIRNGLISAIGYAQAILPKRTVGEDIEDLKGQTILPGFTDSHIHLLEYGLSLRRVDCDTPSRAACIERIEQAAAVAKPGEWILGHGWDHNIWPDGTGSHFDLDGFSKDNPVYLTHKSLHSAWVNFAALKAANINESTPDPDRGHIERDDSGEPNGILLESAMQLVERAIPELSDNDRIISIQAAQQELSRLGITSVHDFDIWPCYQNLSDMELNGQLMIRVIKSIPAHILDEAIDKGIRSGDGSSFLRIGWLKLFSDGALGPQTAAMLMPYEKSKSTGMLFMNEQDISEIGKKAMNAGISLAVHAIGDKANQEVLNGYALLREAGMIKKCRYQPRIEHVQLIAPPDMQRFSSLGITASMQPIHAVYDRKMAETHWGKRCANAYAWNALIQNKTSLIFGSDAPVESPNPFLGLYAAVTRKSAADQDFSNSWIPEQCLNIHQALNAYIHTPQAITNPDGNSGSLQPGYLADLVVMPVDPVAELTDMLIKCSPSRTMVSGRWVFFKDQ